MTQGLIAKVREPVPQRPLSRQEMSYVAEAQALRFVKLLGLDTPPVSEEAIAAIPSLKIARMTPFVAPGFTDWADGRWIIILRGSDIPARQRFSLAHEIKHILDHPFVDILYQDIPETERHDTIERVCEYFAACLLMPRPWMKQVWSSGTQDVRELATIFDVSYQAMEIRLRQLGLVEADVRCPNLKADDLEKLLHPTSRVTQRELVALK